MKRTLLALPLLALPLLLAVGAASAAPRIEFQLDLNTGITFVHHADVAWGHQPSTNFGPGAAVSDYDRDGDLDIYFCDSQGHPNHLYRNDGSGSFTEVGAAAGVADTASYSQMALFIDLNNDGWDDLVVFNNREPITNTKPPRVFENNKDGTFTDRTSGSNLEVDDPIIGGAGAGDYDHDGDLDISVGGWSDQVAYLYRNDGNFTFTDVTAASGAKPSTGILSHWTITHIDLDNDGWQDIFAAVDFDENYVMRNNQDGTFTDMTSGSGINHTGNDMGVAIADIDNDFDLDLYITDITGTGSVNCPSVMGTPCNSLNMNNGSFTFTDTAVAEGVGFTEWGWGTVFFDAELDGDRDLLVVTGFDPFTYPNQPAYLFRNDGTSWVETAANAGIAHTGDSRGLVPFDYDGDGDLDMLITDSVSAPALYENISDRDGNHWLIVQVEGQLLNRSGVGARIFVTVGSLTQMHEVHVGGSFVAGPPLEAHFGVGPATMIDEVRVEFPSGHVVQRFNVPSDQRMLLGPLREVENLRMQRVGGTTPRVLWDTMDDADSYTVFRGVLGNWPPGGDYGSCLDELAATQLDDTDPVAPGTGMFYLVRSETSLGVIGTLGDDGTGQERTQTNPAACPP